MLERYSPVVYPSRIELRVDQGTGGLKVSLVFKALFSRVSYRNKELKDTIVLVVFRNSPERG